MNEVRVLIIEDHPIVCDALESLVEKSTGLMVLGTATDAKEGIERIQQLNPDLVILDLSVSNYDGALLTNLFLETKPDLKVLLFSGQKDENFVYQSLRAGARGYVIKEAPPEELLQAIHYICEGGIWVSPYFSRHVIDSYLKTLKKTDPEKSSFDRLTEREKEVFFLIVSGLETKEITDILHICGTTVAKHRTSLMTKLGVKNIVELTKYAIRNGLTEIQTENQMTK